MAMDEKRLAELEAAIDADQRENAGYPEARQEWADECRELVAEVRRQRSMAELFAAAIKELETEVLRLRAAGTRDATAELSPLRLAELEALAAAATEGPWEYRVGTPAGVEQPRFQCWIPTNKSDALFIAAARTAVPELVREVRRLARENEFLRMEPQRAQFADIRRFQRAERERACKALEAVAGTAPAVLSLDKAGNEAFSHGWNSAIADATAVIRALPDEE